MSFILITCIPVSGLCIYAYSLLSKNIYQDYYDKSNQVIGGVDSNLNIYFKDLLHLTDSVFASKSIQSALTGQVSTDKDRIKRDDKLNDYITNLIGGRADIACISIYSSDYDKIFEYNIRRLKQVNPFNEDVLKMFASYNCKFTVYGPRYEIFGSDYQRNLFTVGRQLKNLDTGAVIGYLMIDIDYSIIEKTIGMSDSDDPSSAMLILDKNNDIIYNSQNSDDITLPYENTTTYQKFTGGKKDLSVTIQSSYFEWSYQMMSNGEALLAKLSNLALFFITVGICSFIVFLICSILISRSVSKPLRRLEEAMRTAESNNFNEILQPIDTYAEVSRLTRRFNVMLVEIQRLLDKEKESWRKEAEMEYKALQLQITPHFLYNSLDSINCLALLNGRQDISEMVLSLAGIFKYNIKYDSRLATLKDEVNHVKNYCMLQAVHYQDSFKICYEIDDKYMEKEVIKFMLQPLVENAIYHGLKEKEMGNLISITAYETNPDFIVKVSDNGAGMDKVKEMELRKQLNLPDTELFKVGKEGSHIGLVNIHLRLKLQYGDKAGVTFETSENNGTSIYIHIPIVI